MPHATITDTTTQTPDTADTPTLITLDTNNVLVGISHTAGSGTITFPSAGVYLIIVTSEISQTTGSSKNVDIWLRLNGADIANSNRRNTVETSDSVQIIAQSYIIPISAGQHIEIFQSVDSTVGSPGIYSFAPTGEPVIPSITVTVNYIST